MFRIAEKEDMKFLDENKLDVVMRCFGFDYVIYDPDRDIVCFSIDGKEPATCPECGEYIYATDNTDELFWFCTKVYHHDCGTKCNDCGDWYPNSYLNEMGDGTLVCDDCLADNWEICRDCETYHLREDMYEGDDGNYFCEECASQYPHCENCDRVIVWSDNVDTRGYHYCDECQADGYGYWESDAVSDYHDGRDSIFISTGSTHTSPYRSNSYMGLELEFENLSTDFAEYCLPEQFKAENDCSVEGGYELISDAMTFKYWKRDINIDELVSNIVDYGGRSGISAGIHLNISTHNMMPSQQAEIIRFVYENWDSLIKFGRRPDSVGDYYRRPPECLDSDYSLIGQCSYHSCGTNTSHTGRMELRFFNSSVDANHIWAILEFGHCIMEIVKACEALTWNSIIEYAKKDGDCEHLITEYENNFESEERNEIISEY